MTLSRPSDADEVVLNAALEPWRGRFPGLGEVSVGRDGSVQARPEPGVPAAEAEAALRHGWADLLSFARRGYGLALGASFVRSGGGLPARALIVSGESTDLASVALGLSERGWLLLSDRPTPVLRRGTTVVAHPRSAPLIAESGAAGPAEAAGRQLRAGSNALGIELARTDEPAVIGGIVHLARRRPGEDHLTALLGRQRFESAAGLIMGGALDAVRVSASDDGRTDAEQVLDDHLHLAAIPAALVRIDGHHDPDVIDRITAWWSESAVGTA